MGSWALLASLQSVVDVILAGPAEAVVVILFFKNTSV